MRVTVLLLVPKSEAMVLGVLEVLDVMLAVPATLGEARWVAEAMRVTALLLVANSEALVLVEKLREAVAEAEEEGERVVQRRKKVFQEVPGVQLERTEKEVQLGPTRTVEGHQGELVVPQATELFESATAPPLLPAAVA